MRLRRDIGYQPYHRKALLLTIGESCAITMDTERSSRLAGEEYRYKEGASFKVGSRTTGRSNWGHLPRFRVFIALSVRVISQQEGATPTHPEKSTIIDLRETVTSKLGTGGATGLERLSTFLPCQSLFPLLKVRHLQKP